MRRITTGATGCIHHWQLGQPSGGIVEGTCKKCGDHRAYHDDESVKIWTRRTSATAGHGEMTRSA